MNAESRARKDYRSFLKSCLGVTLLALSPCLGAATETELAELRALVLSLQADVQALKEQLADGNSPGTERAPARRPDTEPAGTLLAEPTVRSEYGIDFYGFVKLDAYHDSAVTSHQIPFWAMPETEYGNGQFDMTAKETRIGLDFGGPAYREGRLTAKLEMDFYGNISKPGNYDTDHAYELRTRQAYINWDFDDWSLLAGKAWEPYIISIPDSLNFAYYNFQGQVGFRKTQLRLTRHYDLGAGSGLTWVSALLDPWGSFCGGDLDGDGQDDAMDSELPLFSTKLSYQRSLADGHPAEFAFAAVYGQERFDVYDTDFDIWAVQAGFVLQLSDALTWKLSMYKGANLDSLWGNIAQGIFELGEIDGQGGWTQFQFRPSDRLRLNLGYSVDNPDDADLGSFMRSRNETWLVNGYYSFGSSLLLGFEYLNLQTAYKDSSTATDHRVQSSLIYKF